MNLCLCGCGQEAKRKFVHGHNKRGLPGWRTGLTKETDKRLILHITSEEEKLTWKNICKCGCGLKCKNSFINGHQMKGKQHSEITKQKITETLLGNIPWNKGTHIYTGGGWKKGHIPWNLGLTKENSPLVKRISFNIRKAFKEMDPEKIRQWKERNSKTHAGKHFSKEIVEKRNSGVRKAYKERGLEIVEKIIHAKKGEKFPYISKNNEIIKMRSNWEVIYAHYLDSKNYIWKYEPHGFKLSTGKLYFPDFFVETLNEWHEVKGYLSQIAKEKINLFCKEYSTLVFRIIDASSLRQLNLIKESNVFYSVEN